MQRQTCATFIAGFFALLLAGATKVKRGSRLEGEHFAAVACAGVESRSLLLAGAGNVLLLGNAFASNMVKRHCMALVNNSGAGQGEHK